MLRAERHRTGVGVISLFNSRDDVPVGLTTGRVSHWLSGRTKRVCPAELEYVINAWRSLPDDEWVTLTLDLVQQLRTARETSGVSPAVLSRHARMRGIDLTVLDVVRALSGQAKAIRRRHLELMLS